MGVFARRKWRACKGTAAAFGDASPGTPCQWTLGVGPLSPWGLSTADRRATASSHWPPTSLPSLS